MQIFLSSQNLKTKKIISTVFFSLIFLSVFLVGGVAHSASSLLDNQEGFKSTDNEIGKTFGEEIQGPEDIRIIAASVIKIFLGFLGIIFLVLLVIAGFKWMTSSGSEEKIKEAQGQIKNAVIGIIIILASYAIADFIIEQIRQSVEGY